MLPSIFKNPLDGLEIAKWLFAAAYVFSTIGVTVGVYWENEKFDKAKQNRGWKLLIWSLAFDTLFTVMIFGIDGWISQSQRDEIIVLETKLAPRVLTNEQQDTLLEALRPFAKQQYALSVAAGSEPVALLCTIQGVLKKAEWNLEALGNSLHVDPSCADGKEISVNMSSGIGVWVRPDAPESVKAAQSALATGLKANDIEVFERSNGSVANITAATTIYLAVGAKL